MGKQINVAVAGCGTVGSGVVEMLMKKRLFPSTGRDVALKYIIDIKPVDAPEGVTLTGDFDLALKDTDILCETIGGVGIAYKYTKKALEAGVSVVTSNKELVATHGDELKAIAREKGAWYLYEAAVCGGMPVLRPLKTCLAGNEITKFDGIVNGSTNYLITRMEADGASFSAALGEAQRLGYVEANPDDDLLGHDARRKLAILANSAFGSLLSDDKLIPATGITRLTMEDVTLFKKAGYAVKLIAHGARVANDWTGWVRPAIVQRESPLFDVNGVFNGIVLTGDYVDEITIRGRGAGMKPTASAIIGDIIEASRSLDNPFDVDMTNTRRPAFVDPNAFEARIAVRIENADVDIDMPVEKTIPVKNQTLVFSEARPLGELLESDFLKASGVGIPLVLV